MLTLCPTKAAIRLGISAALLLSGTAWIAGLSPSFAYGSDYLSRPILTFLIAYALAFLGYGFAVWPLTITSEINAYGQKSLAFILVVWALVRILILPAQPILESDYYRYMWEGHAVIHGENPYLSAPASLTFEEGSRIKNRINHPDLPTIYPPGALYFFAAVQRLFPWEAYGYRWMALGSDGITVALLLVGLIALKKPLALVLVYAWNPLVLIEGINRMHFDYLVAMCMAGLIAAWACRYIILALWLVWIASLIKWTPGLFLPVLIWIIIRKKYARRSAILVHGILIVLATFLCFIPFLDGGPPVGSLGVFSTQWASNAAVHTVFKQGLILLGAPLRVAQYAATASSSILFSAFLIYWLPRKIGRITLEKGNDTSSVVRLFLIVNLVLFLLSPVGNPWYLLWIVPFLVFFPYRSILFLTAVTMLYFLDFYFHYRNQYEIFHFVKCVEYGLFSAAALLEFRAMRERPGKRYGGYVE